VHPCYWLKHWRSLQLTTNKFEFHIVSNLINNTAKATVEPIESEPRVEKLKNLVKWRTKTLRSSHDPMIRANAHTGPPDKRLGLSKIKTRMGYTRWDPTTKHFQFQKNANCTFQTWGLNTGIVFFRGARPEWKHMNMVGLVRGTFINPNA